MGGIDGRNVPNEGFLATRRHIHLGARERDARHGDGGHGTFATVEDVDARSGERQRERRVDVDGRVLVQARERVLSAESLREDEATVHVVGDFEGLAQRGAEGGGRSGRIAQREGRLLAVPRRPTVHFGARSRPGVAAHPVRIGQHVGIVLLPANGLRQIAPQAAAADRIGQGVVVVELHHARTAGEGAAQLAHDAVVVHVFRHLSVRGEDETVGHQRVDGTQRRVLHEVFVHQRVAIGNPAFAVAALVARFAVVALLAPHGVGVLEPEGRSPRADGGVEEDVGLDGFAHHAFGADDALGVLLAHRARVGTHGRELRTDAVELEEAEIIAATVAQVGDGAREGFVILGVGELHAALAVPEGATIVAALPIAAHRAQPGADARAHFACQGVGFAEAVGEVGRERPIAVVIPAVVPHEGVDRRAIGLEKILFPLAHHLFALPIVHVARIVRVVVAVDVEFVPRDVGRHGAPGHGALAFAVGEEGTARLAGGHETHHGAHLPVVAGAERGVAAPRATQLRGGLRSQVERVALCQREADVARRGDGFVLVLRVVDEGKFAAVGHIEAIDVAFGRIARVALVIVGGHHVARGVHEFETAEVQARVARAVVELHGQCAGRREAEGPTNGLHVRRIVTHLVDARGHALGLRPFGRRPGVGEHLVGTHLSGTQGAHVASGRGCGCRCGTVETRCAAGGEIAHDDGPTHAAGERDLTARIDGFGRRVHEIAQAVDAHRGHVERIDVAAVGVAHGAVVIVRGHHVAVEVDGVDAHEVEFVGAAFVGEGEGLRPCLLEGDVTLRHSHLVGRIAQGGDAGRHRAGGGDGEVVGCPRVVGEGALVTFARAHGVEAHGRFEAGEDLVAQQHGTAGVAHLARRTARGVHVHLVEHGHDGKEFRVARGREFHFRAQVVAAVAQHGAPEHREVTMREGGFEGTAGEFLRPLGGRGIGGVVDLAHVAELHFRSPHHRLPVAGADFKEFGAGVQVELRATAEAEGAVRFDEAGGEQVVAQHVVVGRVRQTRRAGLLFLRENDLLGQGGGRGTQAERQKGGTEQTGGGMKHHRLGRNVGEHSGGQTKTGTNGRAFAMRS